MVAVKDKAPPNTLGHGNQSKETMNIIQDDWGGIDLVKSETSQGLKWIFTTVALQGHILEFLIVRY